MHCVKGFQIRSFFWPVFSGIRTKYGEILRISLYLVRIQKNTDQKKLRLWTLFTQCWSCLCDGIGKQQTKFLKQISKSSILTIKLWRTFSEDSWSLRRPLEINGWNIIFSNLFLFYSLKLNCNDAGDKKSVATIKYYMKPCCFRFFLSVQSSCELTKF